MEYFKSVLHEIAVKIAQYISKDILFQEKILEI